MSNQAESRISAIVGRSLLVTNDPAVVEKLSAWMAQFAITSDTCADPATATSLINTRKFEAITVDLALGEMVIEVLERVRRSPSNQNSVTFALIGPGEEPRKRLESHFVIAKPLAESSVRSTLKAALGLIIRDYRRYFRCPVSASVVIRTEDGEPLDCEILNISEGGLALTVSVELLPGVMVETEFELPDEAGTFQLRAEICWCDRKGRAGLQFRAVPEHEKLRLQAWLSRKLEQSIPEPVARLFQKNSGPHDSAGL